MNETIERYIRELIRRSTPRRTAWNLEKIREGKDVSWNYIDGCMLTALLAMTEITGDDRYAAFVEKVADSFVREDGSIDTFRPEKHALDDYNEGRILFPMYIRTGNEKYRKAAEMLYRSLMNQPRTEEGNFWHKEIYPNQVWLDGTYMALPFLAMYENTFGKGEIRDIMEQLRTVRKKMRDPETGLYYHGYDASRKAFWADPETGMYMQVVNQAGREGNYPETSGSAMIACAMLKGSRLGVLNETFRELGKKTFDGIVRNHLKVRDGMVELDNICLVAGLGPEDNRRRDGSYDYYISEPVVSNDAKGAAPFVLCYTEIRRPEK